MGKNKVKSSLESKIFTIINVVFMVSFVVVTLYPVLNTVAISCQEALTYKYEAPAYSMRSPYREPHKPRKCR